MLRKFLPNRDIFFDFFEKHAAISFEAAKHLVLFAAAERQPDAIFQQIKKCEHEADDITHQCVEVLHKTFITPIDRMEIFHLISRLDDLTDEIEESAKLILLYKLEPLRKESAQLAEILVSSSQEVLFAVREIRKMKITSTIRQHFLNIDKLESEADTILTQALVRLFDEEHDMKTLIKWKEVCEHLENATDVCDDISNILEGIILENE